MSNPEVRGPLGATCRKCGADDWYKRKKGHRACAPCVLRASKARQDAGLAKDYQRRWHLRDRAMHLEKNMAQAARQRARKRGEPCTITAEDVRLVWPTGDCCPACGDAMKMGTPRAPSLDRVICALGYVPGNIAVICLACNAAKSVLSGDQLALLAAWTKAAEAQQAFFEPVEGERTATA